MEFDDIMEQLDAMDGTGTGTPTNGTTQAPPPPPPPVQPQQAPPPPQPQQQSTFNSELNQMANDLSMPNDAQYRQQQREEFAEQSHRLVVLFCNSITELNDTIIMPTTDNIEELWKYACALFAITALFSYFNVYTFISWQGALLHTFIMTFIMFKEKGDQNIIMKAYNQGMQHTVKKKRKRSNAAKKKK